MIFGRIPLALAEGCILAHSTRLPGLVLAKGAVLDAAALARLAQAGLHNVVAARLEPGDVAEDAAALLMAQALLAPGLVCSQPGRGRVNLVAGHAGLFRADAAAVDALNLLHEGITVATLPDATPVAAGALLVTVKIIPFAIPGAVLAAAVAACRASAPLRLPAFQALTVGLVLTELPGLKQAVFQGTVAATEKRVQGLGGTLLPPRRVPHAAPAIAAALQGLLAQGARLLLVAGASATVDRLDEAPAALVLAGGAVLHFGMPVDPGNLICVGRIGDVPALVLPGCARSPSLNGIDLVLARLFAGEPAGPREIAGMGVGGLLKDFAARPAPRAARPKPVAPRAGPLIAAVILAAGLSSRMAPRNKLLLAGADGHAMVARVARAVLASTARPVLAVLGHQAPAVAAALAGLDVRLVQAADFADGLAASLRAGIAAVPAEAAAVLVCLGDMPLVSPAEIDLVLNTYDPDEGRLIVVPTYGGRRGNPVLWDRRFFGEMMALAGDAGARSLLRRFAEHVAEVAVGSDAVLVDFDAPGVEEGVLF